MKRYAGEALEPGFRVAVVANDALGNFVVSTPLLQMLRLAGAGHVAYFGGQRTWEFIAADTPPSFALEPSINADSAAEERGRGRDDGSLIDYGFPLFGPEPSEALKALSGDYDLVVNIEVSMLAKVAAAALAGPNGYVAGPSLGLEGRGELPFPDDEIGRLWADTDWTAPDLTQRYPSLKSGFIGEIFCRGAYLKGDVPPYRVPEAEPSQAIPDVLIATSASLPEKLWTLDGWQESLLFTKNEGLSCGLIGAKPSDQGRYWQGAMLEDRLVSEGLAEDLRGAFTLPQVVGALRKCRAVLTLDNGILHLACAAEKPTVGLFREGIHRLWAPPSPYLTVLIPGAEQSVAMIEPNRVIAELEKSITMDR